jgi:hypothetical protein
MDMTPHWHGYSYTGPSRPKDSDARNPAAPTPPLVIAEWPGKPRSMLAGTFTSVEDAAAWLTQELAATPPLATAVSADLMVRYARERLGQAPDGVVTRYYTASAYAVRDLVPCTGRCPEPPR